MKIMFFSLAFFLLPLLLFAGLNFRQLYSAWALRSEKNRLITLAENAPAGFQNPAPMQDCFDVRVCPNFWKFSIINGNGKVSKESAWHSAAMTFEDGLTISHFFDPEFETESANPMHTPAAGRYNNISLISRHSFQPTPSNDVVLKFSSRVSDDFYGTAGVIFQPAGTLREDGLFVKPFDMFGLSVAGRESSIMGNNGPFCYLALNWMPVAVNSLDVDAQRAHAYEIRLRWMRKTEWLGAIKVDNTLMCEMPMPAFGPVEIHVWSDNFHVVSIPRRWWEIAPAMDLQFLNGGDKQFHLETIQIFKEDR
jgi:hypothetical protein